eukprot:gene7271-12958_t
MASPSKSNGKTQFFRDDLKLSIPDSIRKTVEVLEHELPKISIKPHEEPVLLAFPQRERQSESNSASCIGRMLFFWKLLRIAHGQGVQLISCFVGWIFLMYGSAYSTPTFFTFLPPILSPITDYSTGAECIFQSQQLSKASNMTYLHITVDAGAATKFNHVVWNNPEEFKRVVIHLGDFHGMMESFGVAGKIIQGSGFEEVVYQAGLCTSGGIK